MTPKISLKELKQKAEAATPGPWNVQLAEPEGFPVMWLDGENGEKDPTIHDLNFMDAANPTTVIALCDALERAREAMSGYHGAVESIFLHPHCPMCKFMKEIGEVICE